MIATAQYVMMEASNDSSGSIVPYRVWLMRFGVPWLASGTVSQDVVVAVVVAYSLVVVGVKESLVGIAVFGYSYRSGMPRGSAAFGPSCMFSRLCMLNLLLFSSSSFSSWIVPRAVFSVFSGAPHTSPFRITPRPRGKKRDAGRTTMLVHSGEGERERQRRRRRRRNKNRQKPMRSRNVAERKPTSGQNHQKIDDGGGTGQVGDSGR